MSRRHDTARWHVLGFALVATLLAPAAAAAQMGGPGFLFRQPRVTLGLRTGYAVARAGSDIFDFAREELTLGKNDFNAPMIGVEIALAVSDRFDVAFDGAYSNASHPSEMRGWVGTDDLPIQQETSFSRTPLTVGLKVYLRDRGRAVSRFAWIPGRWAPYVGVGGGVVMYSFKQSGEFVDYDTLDIFRDTYRSDGTAPTFHTFAGVDLSLNKVLLLTGEARYGWASATMGQDFYGFEKMDLAGFQASIGIAARF